jgi:hypothetical protein
LVISFLNRLNATDGQSFDLVESSAMKKPKQERPTSHEEKSRRDAGAAKRLKRPSKPRRNVVIAPSNLPGPDVRILPP